MGLNRVKLGKFIIQSDARNADSMYDEDSVVGLSTQKEIIETKANLSGVNLTSYKLLKPYEFAYVPDTSRRGDKIALALNNTGKTYIISSIYIVFYVSDTSSLLPEYLFMYFNRPEFDRYARTNSWGSARETFNWEDMCDIDINLPDLPTQQKYVNVYKSMLANQQSYEHGLEDLKLICDGYIEDLRRRMPCEKIGQYLCESTRRNDVGLTEESVRGLSTSKEIISTKADMNGVSLTNYKVVSPYQIAYVPDTSRRGDKVSLGFNDTENSYLVSSISVVFGTNQKYLLPEYLMLFLTRKEFDRYARFNSWGSAREVFSFDDMREVSIPIPEIAVQRAIAEVFTVYKMRLAINERLKAQIRDICSILIKGTMEDKSHD